VSAATAGGGQGIGRWYGSGREGQRLFGQQRGFEMGWGWVRNSDAATFWPHKRWVGRGRKRLEGEGGDRTKKVGEDEESGRDQQTRQ
jgi:hypothetical protein